MAEPKSGKQQENSPKDTIDWVVGVALLAVAFVTGGVTYALTKWAQNPRVNEPGPEGYLEFATLYSRTFLLSLTVTIALAVVTVPRIYGRWNNPGYALLVIAIGSYTTGRSLYGPDTRVDSLSNTEAQWIVGGYTKALRLFAAEYQEAYYGGIVVGLAGGIIVSILFAHHRKRQLAKRSLWNRLVGPQPRPMNPWTPVAAFVSVLICVLAFLAALDW